MSHALNGNSATPYLECGNTLEKCLYLRLHGYIQNRLVVMHFTMHKYYTKLGQYLSGSSLPQQYALLAWIVSNGPCRQSQTHLQIVEKASTLDVAIFLDIKIIGLRQTCLIYYMLFTSNSCCLTQMTFDAWLTTIKNAHCYNLELYTILKWQDIVLCVHMCMPITITILWFLRPLFWAYSADDGQHKCLRMYYVSK